MKTFKMVRNEKAEEFFCVRCDKQKKSKNIASNVEKEEEKLCNGCFGLLLSRNEIKRIK